MAAAQKVKTLFGREISRMARENRMIAGIGSPQICFFLTETDTNQSLLKSA
jgi:hypothetical protein